MAAPARMPGRRSAGLQAARSPCHLVRPIGRDDDMSLEDRTHAWRSPAASTAVMLVGTLLAIYMVTQFLRNSVAVIAPELARTLTLSAADLGLLSSVYFFSFALMQLPVGVALDRFGPRRVLVVFAGLMALGCVSFCIGREHRRPGRCASADGDRLLQRLHGLACDLCPALCPRPFRHADRPAIRHRQFRIAVCDRTARLGGGRHRLARQLRGSCRPHFAGRRLDCGRGEGRVFGSGERQARKPARCGRRHCRGDPHAVGRHGCLRCT